MSQRDTWKFGIVGTAGYLALSLVISVIVPGSSSPIASANRQAEKESAASVSQVKDEVQVAAISFQDEAAAEDSAAAEAPADKYHGDNWWLPKSGQRPIAGLTSCAGGGCHSGVTANSTNPEEQNTEGLTPIEIALLSSAGGWHLGNEMTTWIRQDKHAQAYAVLLNDRSKEMAKIMGLVDDQGNSVIHRDKRCLACHASYPLEQLPSDDAMPHLITKEFANQRKLDFDTGVNCEGCHGPSASGWLGPHRDKEKWRFKDPHEKFDDYGYWDVRSPVTKTKICASCHVGNAGQGKVVTHEMYAAGHPPLPGFEIATFIYQEPQHWRDFGAKSEKAQKEFLEKTGEKYDPKAAHKTTKAMIGALVTLGESLRLSADLIDQQAAFPDAGIPKPSWPELANFACFNCHHDLRASSWRQKRSTGLTPGRPNIHEWPLANVMVAVKLAGKEDEFKAAYANVQESIDTTPFGGAEFQENARVVAGWLDSLGREWATKPIARDSMPQVLMTICEVATDENMDYDSTRQLVWLFSAVYNEWKNPIEEGQLPAGFDGWYPNEEKRDDIETVLAQMSEHLLLDLKAGRKADQQDINGIKRDTIEVDATVVLPKIADFDPQTAVRESFMKLKNLLSSGE